MLCLWIPQLSYYIYGQESRSWKTIKKYIILLQFKKSCYLTFKYTEVVLCSFNTTYTSNKYKVHADTKCCAKLALWQVTDHAYKNMSDTKKISNVNTEIFTTFSYSEFFSLRNSLAGPTGSLDFFLWTWKFLARFQYM